jgi:hypothetical protein
MDVRKIIRAVLILSALVGLLQCGRKGPQIEKTTEDGVEVVINHLEPYSLPGVPSALQLEEVLSIDTEKDDIVKTGLTSIESFCLDQEGNIYFMMRQSPEQTPLPPSTSLNDMIMGGVSITGKPT